MPLMPDNLPNFKGILGCKVLPDLLIAYKNIVLELMKLIFFSKTY